MVIRSEATKYVEYRAGGVRSLPCTRVRWRGKSGAKELIHLGLLYLYLYLYLNIYELQCLCILRTKHSLGNLTEKYFLVLYLFICLQVCNLLNVFTIHVFIVRMLIFCMYDCHRQSVNNSLFSLCLYFDFTINYGQHSPMFVFVIVFEGESTEGGAR